MILANTIFEKPTMLAYVTTQNFGLAVVCQRTADEWEPLFGVVRTLGKMELPENFSLNKDCLQALDALIQENEY